MIVRRSGSSRWSIVLAVAGLLAALALAGALPARAVNATLTVTTLDRTGRAVPTQVGVVDVDRGTQRYFATGHAQQLPPGRYDVYAAIASPAGAGDTVGVERALVSGATGVTIDARQGRPVVANLLPAPPSGFTRQTSVWLCASQSAMVGGGAFDGAAYAIPSALPEVSLSFAAAWSPMTNGEHADTVYLAGSVYRHGVPAGLTRTFRQADLTNVVLRGRSGLQSGDAQIDVRAASSDDCRNVAQQVFPRLSLPYALNLHVSAGSWSFGQFAQDSVYGPARSYAAARTYSLTAGAAAWGPGGYVMPTIDQYCRCLEAASPFMFTDRLLPSGAQSRVSYRLYTAGRLIAQRTIDPEQGSFAPKLPRTGWYVLTAFATRHPIKPLPSNPLSPRTSIRLRFHADPGHAGQVGGYVTGFDAYGLGSDNHARTKTTSVGLRLLRSPAPSADRHAVRSMRVWMSGDNGRTWHATPVHHAGGRWSTVVANPSSGFVWLRATVTDRGGNVSTTEVVRAYAVTPVAAAQ